MMVVDPHKHLTLAHRAIWGLVLLLLAFASRLGHDMMLIRADPIPSQLLSLSLVPVELAPSWSSGSFSKQFRFPFPSI